MKISLCATIYENSGRFFLVVVAAGDVMSAGPRPSKSPNSSRSSPRSRGSRVSIPASTRRAGTSAAQIFKAAVTKEQWQERVAARAAIRWAKCCRVS